MFLQEWEDSGRTLGYKLRRRFRAALAYFTGYQDDSWGITSWEYANENDPNVRRTGPNVFCAINLFNQPHVYRYSGYNGYCYLPSRNSDKELGQPSFSLA